MSERQAAQRLGRLLGDPVASSKGSRTGTVRDPLPGLLRGRRAEGAVPRVPDVRRGDVDDADRTVGTPGPVPVQRRGGAVRGWTRGSPRCSVPPPGHRARPVPSAAATSGRSAGSRAATATGGAGADPPEARRARPQQWSRAVRPRPATSYRLVGQLSVVDMDCQGRGCAPRNRNRNRDRDRAQRLWPPAQVRMNSPKPVGARRRGDGLGSPRPRAGRTALREPATNRLAEQAWKREAFGRLRPLGFTPWPHPSVLRTVLPGRDRVW